MVALVGRACAWLFGGLNGSTRAASLQQPNAYSERSSEVSLNEGVLSQLEVVVLLLLLQSHFLGLGRSQTATESASPSVAEVPGRVLGVLVQGAGGVTALLAEDGEDAGDGLSHGLWTG